MHSAARTSGRYDSVQASPAILRVVLRDVVALVGEDVAVFELGVVSEVFGIDRTGDGLPGYQFSLAGVEPGLVPTTSGFGVQVLHGLERLERADLIAVPSWTTQDRPVPVPLVAALHAAVERGARVLSVCSGAFLLAGAGLLDDRRATTHWRYAPILAARFPQVLVDPDVLYVDSGQVLTSAGTAAGIDACLYLVRLEHGAAVANALARRMVVGSYRAGGQAQFIEAPMPRGGEVEFGELLDWATAHLAELLTVEVLARRALMSPRTFARRFTAATGTTPHRWLLEQRLHHAEQLLETTSLSIDEISRHSGLGSPDTLRHHFARRRGISPMTYRRTFGTPVGPPG